MDAAHLRGMVQGGKEKRSRNSAIYATPLRSCPKARANFITDLGQADCNTTFYCTHTVRFRLAPLPICLPRKFGQCTKQTCAQCITKPATHSVHSHLSSLTHSQQLCSMLQRHGEQLLNRSRRPVLGNDKPGALRPQRLNTVTHY